MESLALILAATLYLCVNSILSRIYEVHLKNNLTLLLIFAIPYLSPSKYPSSIHTSFSGPFTSRCSSKKPLLTCPVMSLRNLFLPSTVSKRRSFSIYFNFGKKKKFVEPGLASEESGGEQSPNY